MEKHKKMSTISHLFVKAGFLAVTLFAMNGCSVFNVGESEYSCPGRSKGVTCANTREIYTGFVGRSAKRQKYGSWQIRR